MKIQRFIVNRERKKCGMKWRYIYLQPHEINNFGKFAEFAEWIETNIQVFAWYLLLFWKLEMSARIRNINGHWIVYIHNSSSYTLPYANGSMASELYT